MAYKKITDADLVGVGVIGLADTPQLSAQQMQEKFEETARTVIIPRFNKLVQDLNTDKESVYTKEETDSRIADKIIEAGAGDMVKKIYDTDGDGIVDNAEKLGGQLPSYYAKKTEVQTAQTAANNAQTAANSAQTTANNAMPKPTAITAGLDMDKLTETAAYVCTGSTTPANAPCGNGFWFVYRHSQYVKPVWYRVGTPGNNDHNIYVRTSTDVGSTWSEWRNVITDKGGDINSLIRYSGGANSVVQAAQYCFRNIYIANGDDTAATTGSIKMWRK